MIIAVIRRNTGASCAARGVKFIEKSFERNSCDETEGPEGSEE